MKVTGLLLSLIVIKALIPGQPRDWVTPTTDPTTMEGRGRMIVTIVGTMPAGMQLGITFERVRENGEALGVGIGHDTYIIENKVMYDLEPGLYRVRGLGIGYPRDLEGDGKVEFLDEQMWRRSFIIESGRECHVGVKLIGSIKKKTPLSIRKPPDTSGSQP